MKELIGLVSGFIVFLSAVPYGIRTYQRKIKPNMTSWSIWALLGLAILLTYKSSGAESNLWPAVFGFTSPLIIAILAVWRGNRKRPTRLEVACAAFGITSIVLWCFVQNEPATAQYSLYIAIIADLWAGIPTLVFLWNNPKEDRPVAWSVYAVGYGIAVFAITEHTFANYVLPLYMFAMAGAIACLLVVYRVKNGVPLKEWW